MAIKVKCKCGKAFGAPDNYGGKRVKCPGCGDPISIPADQEDANVASKIKVACECGKSVAVKAELAGKRIKCPGCSQPLAVPGGTTTPAKKASKPAPVSGASPGVGDLLDEADLSATNTGQRCPECRFDMGADDILCIQCGYRVDRGRKMETKKVVKPTGMSMSAGPSQGTSAPAEVKSLVWLLRLVANISIVLSVLSVIGFVAMSVIAGQNEPQIGGAIAGAFMLAVMLPGVVVQAIVIWLIFFTAKKVSDGKKSGWILAVIVGVLHIGIILGIFILMKALSPEVKAYCTR